LSTRGDRPRAEDAAPRLRLRVERREAHDIAVSHEERDNLRQLVEIPVENGRVEEDRKRQPARPLALLRQIEMRGDVDEPRFDSFLSKSREALMPFVNSEGRIPSARMRRTMAKGCVISRATQPIGRAAPSTGADPIGRWRSSLAARG
jgi:hypothetical protein